MLLLASTFKLYTKPYMYNLSMPLVQEYIYSYAHEPELHHLGAIKMGEDGRHHISGGAATFTREVKPQSATIKINSPITETWLLCQIYTQCFLCWSWALIYLSLA